MKSAQQTGMFLCFNNGVDAAGINLHLLCLYGFG